MKTTKGVREMAINNDPAIAKAEELLERLGSLDEVKRYYEAFLCFSAKVGSLR